MLQLKNSTPFAAAMNVIPDAAGIDTLFLIVKATFSLGDGLRPAELQVAPVLSDVYWREPGQSSLKYASEAHLGKPGTNVVFMGQARPPDGKAVAQLDSGIAVAEKQKIIRVFGNRQWRKGGDAISPPDPFERMPIVYEKAYGGIQETDHGQQGESRNPVGLGFVGDRKGREIDGLPLPNIEDPRSLLSRAGDVAEPACLGFVAPAWMPRRGFAGTYDQTWQETRAPYLPVDFDPRFFNCGHPDLIFDRYLQGGEPVQAINVSRTGPLRFMLPHCEFEATATVLGRKDAIDLHLETVLIEPEEQRVCLTWRGRRPCDKQALKIDSVTLGLQRMQLEQTAQ